MKNIFLYFSVAFFFIACVSKQKNVETMQVDTISNDSILAKEASNKLAILENERSKIDAHFRAIDDSLSAIRLSLEKKYNKLIIISDRLEKDSRNCSKDDPLLELRITLKQIDVNNQRMFVNNERIRVNGVMMANNSDWQHALRELQKKII